MAALIRCMPTTGCRRGQASITTEPKNSPAINPVVSVAVMSVA
jgi:hypothetical protein